MSNIRKINCVQNFSPSSTVSREKKINQPRNESIGRLDAWMLTKIYTLLMCSPCHLMHNLKRNNNTSILNGLKMRFFLLHTVYACALCLFYFLFVLYCAAYLLLLLFNVCCRFTQKRFEWAAMICMCMWCTQHMCCCISRLTFRLLGETLCQCFFYVMLYIFSSFVLVLYIYHRHHHRSRRCRRHDGCSF